MKLTPEEYQKMQKQSAPHSRLGMDCLWAFAVGGSICCLGQALNLFYSRMGLDKQAAGTAVSITLIGLSAVLTALGWYRKLAVHAGAGTLVPITGFANAVVSPAIEFKPEGLVTGTAAKMFTIAGPVLVYGTAASALYGVVLLFLR